MNSHLLKNIPLFASLPSESLSELAGLLQRKTYPAHHTIFWMNEKGDRLYIIQKGSVQISYTDEEGQEIDLAVLKQGSFFGELSLIDGGPHSATARTLSETAVLTLDSASFYQFLNKHPQISYTLMEVLSLRLRNSTSKVSGLANANQQLKTEQSSFQHFIDKLATALTSSVFVTIYVFFIIGWITAQVFFYRRSHHHEPISFVDKPPTFYILGFIITLTSFLLTVLILNSQRRQAEMDRIRGEIEYQVNVKSQTEVMKLQLKMDQLINLISKTDAAGTTPDNENEKV